MAEIDPVTLEILWTRLITVANEQAAALQRTSFTPIVRESGDLSAAVFDAQIPLELFAAEIAVGEAEADLAAKQEALVALEEAVAVPAL